MTRQTVGFIGGGNMARAIAGGLIRSGFGAGNILISTPRAAQRALLEREFPGAVITADNRDVAAGAGNLLLAVKPQILKAVCTELKATVQKQKPLVISIAAGPTVDDIDAWLGGNLEVGSCRTSRPWSIRAFRRFMRTPVPTISAKSSQKR
jgi:pyrroline-5-carboxylate reductase